MISAMDRFHLQLRQSIFLLKFSTTFRQTSKMCKAFKRLASYPISPSNHSKLLGLTFQRSWFIHFVLSPTLKDCTKNSVKESLTLEI